MSTLAQSELVGITGLEIFVAGFRIGGRLILEMLEDDDGCFRDITLNLCENFAALITDTPPMAFKGWQRKFHEPASGDGLSRGMCR